MADAAYHAEYRAKPENIARKAAWYEANKDKIKEQKRKYHLANKEKFVEKARVWAKNNPNRVKESAKGTRKRRAEIDAKKTKDWRLQNPEKYKAQMKNYREANRSKLACKEKTRQAAKLQSIPRWSDEFFIEEIYDLASRRSKLTAIKWEVDHIVPLKSRLVCGLHCEQNLAVIPATVNRSKRNFYWPDMP